MDSVVSSIPPAEAGGWPSSTRLVSKNKPDKSGLLLSIINIAIKKNLPLNYN